MITWVLVVWFGFATSQSSFAISNITNQAECQRLGRVVSKDLPTAKATCYPYRSAK